MRTIIFGGIIVHKGRMYERGPYILVEWSFAKERINESKRYILVEWLCVNKRSE